MFYLSNIYSSSQTPFYPNVKILVKASDGE